MKKKLLTVLLSAVMIFGVFGLTACSGSNPDDSYNYYSSKYSVEGEVKLVGITYLSLYKMAQTSGSFLVYVDAENDKATADNMKAINKLAQDWNVTIYHFNPVLSGGYKEDVKATDVANYVPSNVLSEKLADYEAQPHANVNTEKYAGIYNLTKGLQEILPGWDKVKSGDLLAISGAPKTFSVTNFGNTSKGENVDIDTEVITPAAGTGTDNTVEPKYRVNEKVNGKISACNSGKDAWKSIAAACERVPSYGQYVESKPGFTVPSDPAAYSTAKISSFNIFADGRFHMYNEDGTNAFTDEKTDVYSAIPNYAQFAELISKNDGYFAVFFGGAWCPNTQAIATLSNDMAKDYGISKIYFFDPILDDRAVKTEATATLSGDPTKASSYTITVTENGSNVAGYAINTRTQDWGYVKGAKAASAAAQYSYSHLYGYFLEEYITTYDSYWNLRDETEMAKDNDSNTLMIKINGSYTRKGGKKGFGKMCVPNIMMFNGEGEGNATLVKWAEAEYNYGIEYQAELWDNAVSQVFEVSPYAHYNPIPEEEEVSEDAAASSGGSSAPAASADAGAC